MQAFLRDGYHGSGLKAILDDVGVPKGSFYNYFESKEDFACEVIRHYGACMAAEIDEALTEAGSPLAGLRLFFERQAAGFEASDLKGGCLVANLGAELDDSPACRGALQETMQGYVRCLTSIVASAQGAGEIRKDEEAGVLASLLSDAWEGAVIRMKIQQSLAPLHQVLNRFLDGFLKP